LAHYSHAIRRGANRIASSGELKGLSHFACVNPDGGAVAVLSNTEMEREVILRLNGTEAEAHLPADSVTTLTWRA
jgi:O-glycosyl hydrolase